jgi:hypothetical protein
VLLGALQKLVGLLDETSASGKAIREVLGAFAQPFADAVEAALPYLEAFLEGILFGALTVALIAIKIKNALGSLIPASLTKNIDWLQVAFVVATGLTLAFLGALTLLAAVAFVLALPFITILAVIVAIGVAIVTVIDAIIGEFDKVDKAFDEMGWADIGGAIIDGIIGGLKDGAMRLYNSIKELATGSHDSFKEGIKSKSPSWLFRLAGRTIPEGTALGIEDETPQVEAATANMTSPALMGQPSGNASSGSGGGQTTIRIEAGAVVIQGVPGAEEMNNESFLRRLAMALVTAARSGGVSPEPETA